MHLPGEDQKQGKSSLLKKAMRNALRLKKKKKGRILRPLGRMERREWCSLARLCHSHRALGFPWGLYVNVGRRSCAFFSAALCSYPCPPYSGLTVLSVQGREGSLLPVPEPRPGAQGPTSYPVFCFLGSFSPSVNTICSSS